MTIEQMRKYVANRYPRSKNWQEKVKDMPNNQVIAVYNSFILRDSVKEEASNKIRNAKTPKEEYHQINLFEVFGNKILY